METLNIIDPANDPAIFEDVRTFLNALNSGGGTPLEQLSPADARNVLVGAQNSVEVDLSGIETSEKTITQDGITVKLDIVKPAGATEKLPVCSFSSTAAVGYSVIFLPTNASSVTWSSIQVQRRSS